MEIRLSSPEDIPELYKIWEICFGDSRETVDMFFRNSYSSENTLVAEEKGIICAAMYLLPEAIYAENREYKAFYLYALGTLPEFRRQGIMGRMIAYAEKICRSRNAAYLFLVPADEKLFLYYEKHGFVKGFRQKKIIAEKKSFPSFEKSFEFSPSLYKERRRENLKNFSFTDWRENEIRLNGEYSNGGNGEALPCCFAEHREEYDLLYDVSGKTEEAGNSIIKDRVVILSPATAFPEIQGEYYFSGMYRKLSAELPELYDTFMGITLG